MKPVICIDPNKTPAWMNGEHNALKEKLEAEGYFVIFSYDNAVTMLDPNQYDVKETEQYVTIDATGPKAGTPCS